MAVLLCALASRPYADMGIDDECPYALMARHLANTGHIAYNGWATAMLGWQLYLGAAFIKLFGYSFASVRMSTLLVAMAMAWLLQRTLALAGINERNATLGTLGLMLSPLFLALSVTYMSDMFGLFAVVMCVYGCLRALQAATERATIAWLCFAVATNAIFGSARQIAWLGLLVMVPSALYVLGSRKGWRKSRKVLWAGAAATAAGALFLFACMQWFARQPYSIPEHLVKPGENGFYALSRFFHASLGLPFLLLPIVILFLPELGRDLRRTFRTGALASVACGLILLILHVTHAEAKPVLEPTMGAWGDWISKYDVFVDTGMGGSPPIFLGVGTRVVLTIASLGGLLGLVVSLLGPRADLPETEGPRALSWRELGILLAPFTAAYSLLLIPRAATKEGIFDRYLLELLVVMLLCVVRWYQERVQERLPPAAVGMVCLTAIYGVALVHNMFSYSRARLVLAAEIRASGVPDTSVNNGWEYNFAVELRHSSHLNDPHIEFPANGYAPVPPLPPR